MRKSRFTEEQKVKMLQEADRTSVAEVAKKHGVSNETIYSWRRKFGGIPCPFGPPCRCAPGAVRLGRTVDVSEAKRLKQLEQENTRLKKLVAERDLEIEVMKEIPCALRFRDERSPQKNGERVGTS